MSFLGYEDGKMLLIAAIEIVVGILFLRRATRPLACFWSRRISAGRSRHIWLHIR
jgi:hypothetical protein